MITREGLQMAISAFLKDDRPISEVVFSRLKNICVDTNSFTCTHEELLSISFLGLSTNIEFHEFLIGERKNSEFTPVCAAGLVPNDTDGFVVVQYSNTLLGNTGSCYFLLCLSQNPNIRFSFGRDEKPIELESPENKIQVFLLGNILSAVFVSDTSTWLINKSFTEKLI